MYNHSFQSPEPYAPPTNIPQLTPPPGQRRRRESRQVIINASTSAYAKSPTPSQQRALIVLEKLDSSEVLAWLRILRCLKPGYQHTGASGEVSADELKAASLLKLCTDEQVRYWLKLANPNAVAQISPASTPPLSTNHSLDQSVSRHESKSFGSNDLPSVVSSSLYNGQAGQSTLPSSLSDGTARSRKPITKESSTASSKKNAHDHWCTICERPKHYRTCDGWKRHMREHENVYPCMPDGPIYHTGSGPQCCFCDRLDPNSKHLDSHSVSSCREGTKTMPAYTRRANLIKHIEEVHQASNTSALKLAHKWQIRQKNQRRYFSCGFCVSIFSTLKEQSNHIDKEHWSRHQNPRAWDTNNVILGLLQQSEVSEAWQSILARHNIRSDSSQAPSWNSTTIKDLQLKLEISQDPAQDLVNMAFTQSSYYQSHQVELNLGTAPHQSYEDQVTMEGISTSQHPGINPNIFHIPPSEINNFADDRNNFASYCDEPAGQSGPNYVSSRCDLQSSDTVSDNFSTGQIDGGTCYFLDSLTDQPKPRQDNTYTTKNFQCTHDGPWTTYATKERQIDESETPYQDFSGAIPQDSHESHYRPLLLESPQSKNAYHTGPQAQRYPMFDTHTIHNSHPSTDDASPVMTTNAPVRKRPPQLVLGPKRKRSPITSSENPFEQGRNHVIDMGNHSQYREQDDRVRRTRRMGYG